MLTMMEIDLRMLKMPWGCWLGMMGKMMNSSEDGKVMKNLVSFGARKEESSESSNSDVDTDSEDYHYDDLAEELAVEYEKNESLEKEVSNLKEVATGEQERARMLERDLAENCKQIRTLNSGSRDLDKILSMGQPAKVNWGLGY
ncbi:hypothetical protein F2Q69_00008742 [Brassica cretica]|uniref:Uncharacterized protein n=1 Tax=Brassica cretica TaxID=69181 RepID=A0A8S9P1Y8_BRACR|nr:hypothetical protein F2Q69_00008742 [Brassica cretica]